MIVFFYSEYEYKLRGILFTNQYSNVIAQPTTAWTACCWVFLENDEYVAWKWWKWHTNGNNMPNVKDKYTPKIP